MDSDILKLGSGMILGGAFLVLFGSNIPGNLSGDASALGWLAFVLGSLILALAVVENN